LAEKAKLKKGKISEEALVEKLCTNNQYLYYRNKNKFQGGIQKKTFLQKLSRLCDYEYNEDEKTFFIKEIYKYPKPIVLPKLKDGIYQHLAPLILNDIVNHHDKNNKTIITSIGVAHEVEMINRNYDKVKYNIDTACYDLNLPFYTMAEYFDKADTAIRYYIKKCLQYLKDGNYIILHDIFIICTFINNKDLMNSDYSIKRKEDVHLASDEEMKVYSSCVGIASRYAGIEKDNEKYYGRKSKKFQDKLKDLLFAKNIKYVYQGFEMYYTDLERCKNLLNEFNDMPLDMRKNNLCEVFKYILNFNAKTRFDKGKIFDEEYLKHFETLSDITILKDAEDILPKLSSYKTKEDKIQDEIDNIKITLEVTKTNNLNKRKE
jgi:hypothetical protein